MADTKLSALAAVTTPAATDQLYVNQGGASKSVTLSVLESYPVILGMPRGLPVSATVPTGWVADYVGSVALAGAVNLSLAGTGELVLTDNTPSVPNLVLAGRA